MAEATTPHGDQDFPVSAGEWGLNLFDQFDTVSKKANFQLEQYRVLSKFMKERAELEQKHVTGLKQFMTQWNTKIAKHGEVTPLTAALAACVKETNELTKALDKFSDNLMSEVYKRMKASFQEISDEFQRLQDEGAKAESQFQEQVSLLENAKEKYHSKCKEAEQAIAAKDSKKTDLGKMQKLMQDAQEKQAASKIAEKEYHEYIIRVNQFKLVHEYETMPKIMGQFYYGQKKIVERCIGALDNYIFAHGQVIPAYRILVERLTKQKDETTTELELKKMMRDLISGDLPGEEIEKEFYEDKVKRSGSMKSKLNKLGRKNNKSEGMDISKMSPEQQTMYWKDRLQTATQDKIRAEELVRNSASEEDRSVAERRLTSAIRMIYKATVRIACVHKDMELPAKPARNDIIPKLPPKLFRTAPVGDPSIQSLNGSNLSLPLHDVNSISSAGGTTPILTPGSTARTSPNGSVGEINVSPGDPAPSKPRPSRPSRKGTSSLRSTPAATPVAPTYKMLYDFDASTGTEVSCIKDEVVELLEPDDGDGWMKIRKFDGGEGFVPAAYCWKI
eukprot:Clim_evm18s141 gene=Clim_evmTU18s141